jgi:hypothetical protein
MADLDLACLVLVVSMSSFPIVTRHAWHLLRICSRVGLGCEDFQVSQYLAEYGTVISSSSTVLMLYVFSLWLPPNFSCLCHHHIIAAYVHIVLLR